MSLNIVNNTIHNQQCGDCRYQTKCYSEKASPRNIVLNILACRIKLGIDSNNSAKLFLSMVRPNLIKLVHKARSRVGDGYIDIDSLLLDLESHIIESLLDEEKGYKIGESAYLTEYLFGTNPRTGWVRKYILWNFSKQQKFYKKHQLFGSNPKSDTDEDISEYDRGAIAITEADVYNSPEDSNDDAVEQLMSIINDGITLNANEHRVITFCLSHANESNKSRLIDGTHTYLSSIMGVSRPRITRLFAVARKKLLHAAESQGIGLN